MELGERLRTGTRDDFPARRAPLSTPAEELWRMGSILGAQACGFPDAGGTIEIDRAAPELALVGEDVLLDAIVFSGSSGMVKSVIPPIDENHKGEALADSAPWH